MIGKKSPHFSIVTVVITIAALLLVAPAAVLAFKTTVEKVVEDLIDIGKLKSIFVETENGSISIIGYDGDQINIKVTMTVSGENKQKCVDILESIDMKRFTKDTELHLKTDTPSKFGYSSKVSYELKVPRKMKLRAESVNGSVEANGVYGGSKLNTVNGEIVCMDLHGGMRVETVNGRIKLTDVKGDTDASTVNGNIRCHFSGEPPLKLKMESVNGSIDITFSKEPDAAFDIETFNGSIEFFGKPVAKGEYYGPREYRAELGNGKGNYSIETVNGSIELGIK